MKHLTKTERQCIINSFNELVEKHNHKYERLFVAILHNGEVFYRNTISAYSDIDRMLAIIDNAKVDIVDNCLLTSKLVVTTSIEVE